MEKNNIKNKIIIISGPSGAGEDSIIDGLGKIMPIERIITTTTRPVRPGEKQGKPYYFISKKIFLKKIKEKKFFEHARHYNGHYYGVTLAEIKKIKKSGKISIWKIEYQGVMSIKKLMPEIKSIFISSPLKVLEKRIKKRDRVGKNYVRQRMEYTKKWLKHKDIYDYEVENRQGQLDKAVKKAAKIIKQIT